MKLLRTKIFVAGDENLLCAKNTYQRFLSLTKVFNIKHASDSFLLLTTEGKIFVASDKNRAVCARLNLISSVDAFFKPFVVEK